MKLSLAIQTLGIRAESISLDDVKNAYREASKKYHPDINPAGEDMMKIINNARDRLLSEAFPIIFNIENEEAFNFGELVNKALNEILDIPGISIEVCGAWVWVSGDTKTHWPKLKEAGFWYAPKKQQCYYRPPEERRRRGGYQLTMDEIRQKYGTHGIKTRRPYALSGS